jgi:endoglucanase
MQYSHRNPLSHIAMLSFTAALGCASAPPSGLGISTDPVEVRPAPAGSPVAVHGHLRVEGTNLVDESGNPVQLKGVSSMWLNWETRSYLGSRAAFEYMRDAWKLSVVRAAMGTDAFNGYLGDGKGVMLNKMETIIKNALDTGVYVLVDWHTEMAVDQQDEAVEFFSGLARKYGAHPNIIWETYNEPAGVLWPRIRPYHEAVVDAIRAEDPDNVIVMGTPTWSQDVDVASLDPVRPASGTANLMYALHFYTCTHQQRFRDKGDTAIANGLAIFVTEFGATPANGGTKDSPYICRDDANLWFEWMATNNISGVAWKLDRCADTSCIFTNTAPLDGPWTDDVLTSDVKNTAVQPGLTQGGGHGLLVVDWMRQ